MEPLVSRFNTHVKTITGEIISRYNRYKCSTNRKLYRDYEKDHPMLKRHKGKVQRPSFNEVIRWKETQTAFTKEELTTIVEYHIHKITGIYKHGQTDKTGLCNKRVLANIEMKKLSILITKNTLDAKEQWETRLINSLKEKYPTREPKDIILVLSSKVNDLGGNATHCKSVDEVISKYTRGNFMIIFVCSNNTRFEDIITFLESYDGLSINKKRYIDIQQDEAHNREEGLPSKREMAEYIIMCPYVETFVPVTASYEPLIQDNSFLWKKSNLDKYAIDYTSHSQTISTSKDYSSISDANQIIYEKLKEHPSYTDYKIREFDEETFIEADAPGYYSSWTDEDKIRADRNRRRQLEFVPFMDLEIDACNTGMNIIDNIFLSTYVEGDTTITTSIILPNVFNLHTITTPNRVVLSLHLIKHALTKDYNPLCIGLYRGRIHVHYKNTLGQLINTNYSELSDTCSSDEFNNKLNEIFESLKKKGESVERPVLIIGNYKPIGESITFVNYKYGTIRSSHILAKSGQTREMDYQGLLRCAYMDTKFVKHNPNFTHPAKWIGGSQKCIDNAIYYEKQNDARILSIRSGNAPSLIPDQVGETRYEDTSNISIPVRISIEDMDDPRIEILWNILSNSKRFDTEKKLILTILNDMRNENLVSITDYTGKLDLTRIVVKDVRTWKAHTEIEIEQKKLSKGDKYKPFEDDYRFAEYNSNHSRKQPYINNKNNIHLNECEILFAYDRYKYNDFINPKACVWLSYKY